MKAEEFLRKEYPELEPFFNSATSEATFRTMASIMEEYAQSLLPSSDLEESLREFYRNRDPELTDEQLEVLMKESKIKPKDK